MVSREVGHSIQLAKMSTATNALNERSGKTKPQQRCMWVVPKVRRQSPPYIFQ